MHHRFSPATRIVDFSPHCAVISESRNGHAFPGSDRTLYAPNFNSPISGAVAQTDQDSRIAFARCHLHQPEAKVTRPSNLPIINNENKNANWKQDCCVQHPPSNITEATPDPVLNER